MSSEVVVDSPPEDWLGEAINAWEEGEYPAATAAATIAIALVAIQDGRRCPVSDEHAHPRPRTWPSDYDLTGGKP